MAIFSDVPPISGASVARPFIGGRMDCASLRTVRIQLTWVLLPVLAAGLACTAEHPAGPPSTSPSATVRTVATAAATPRCADGIVAGLTEDQRIGQLLFLGLAGNQLGTAERGMSSN